MHFFFANFIYAVRIILTKNNHYFPFLTGFSSEIILFSVKCERSLYMLFRLGLGFDGLSENFDLI